MEFVNNFVTKWKIVLYIKEKEGFAVDFNRRDFLKMGTAVGVMGLLPGHDCYSGEDIVDMVAVRNGAPAQMFEIGIKAMGGMGRFIKKGQSVAIKPNASWNRTPSQGANVNPELVAKVVEMAVRAGAGSVHAFDNTCNEWSSSYRNSGIENAVREGGGIMVPAHDIKEYRNIKVKGAKVLKEAYFNKLYLDADVFINLAILKHHSATLMTSALKNMMGVVYDRRFFHRQGLHQCISEVPLIRKPDLTIIDAYNVMMRNGPRGLSEDDLRNDRMQIIGTDMVAIDVACSAVMDIKHTDIAYIGMAESHGIGTTDLSRVNIKRIMI